MDETLLRVLVIARATLLSNATKLAQLIHRNATRTVIDRTDRTVRTVRTGPIDPTSPARGSPTAQIVQNNQTDLRLQIGRPSPAAQINRAVQTNLAVQINLIAPIDQIAQSHPVVLISQIDQIAPAAQTDLIVPTGLIAPIVPTLQVAPIARRRNVRPVLNRVRGFLAASYWLLASPALGQSPSADALFAQGRSAFERQDFAAALESFEAALAAQLQGPAIHYNIGVAAYRLQRFDRARTAFKEAARTPAMAALAHYNLGLIAKAQQDDVVAREEFAIAYSASEDERVQSLARTQLDLLDADTPASQLAWTGFASTGIGYDDNVTLSSEGQALGVAREEDVYGDTQLVGSLSLTPSWRIDGDASFLNYADLNEFDQWGVGAGARHRLTFEAWILDSGAHVSTSYLDRDRFDARQAIYLQAMRSISSSLTVRARYRLSNVDGSDRYPGLDGQRHEVSARLIKTERAWSASFTYLFDRSNYDSASYSAARHQLSADARAPLALNWTGRVALSYRKSDYDAATIDSENRLECTIGAERTLSQHLTAVVQYSRTDNDSDFEGFSYTRNRVFAGIEAIF